MQVSAAVARGCRQCVSGSAGCCGRWCAAAISQANVRGSGTQSNSWSCALTRIMAQSQSGDVRLQPDCLWTLGMGCRAHKTRSNHVQLSIATSGLWAPHLAQREAVCVSSESDEMPVQQPVLSSEN